VCQLTIEVEEEWDQGITLIDKVGLLDSGEDLEKHDSDDINFYNDSSHNDDKEEGVTKH
jgi:hypothetical protein